VTIGSHDKGGERGAVLVEFSLVVVLFIALLYGLIAYGMAFALKQSMTNAVSEAARSAVGAPGGGEVETAYVTAEDRLGWLNADRCCQRTTDASQAEKPMDLTAQRVDCGSVSLGCMKVEATYDYAASPLVPIMRLPGFSAIFPDSITSQATVRLPATTTTTTP